MNRPMDVEKGRQRSMGLGMAIGMLLGAALGTILLVVTGNASYLAIFAGGGLSVGVALGVGLAQQDQTT
jgi:hypothetical protein